MSALSVAALVESLREEAEAQRDGRAYFSPEPGDYDYVDHHARETVAHAFERLASRLEGAAI